MTTCALSNAPARRSNRFLNDEKGKLAATGSLRRLIAAGPDAPALTLVRSGGPVTVSPMTGRDPLADSIRRHNLLAVPVVDKFARLLGIVTFGSIASAMLPFTMKRLGFDPASSSAPFVATLVDVTGL